jgi:hypothetical protein
MTSEVGSTLSLTMRPTKFEDVIGLADEVATIRAKIDSGNIPRGFLLTGPYGCGKTTLAWLIAHAVQGWEFDGTPQVQEINAAHVRGIDAMRSLADSAGAYPMVGKYAITILDEAQQLTPPAQQILLKELEVKRSPTIWILATTDPEKINSGVRDRCFPIRVRGLDEAGRAELVQRAAKQLDHAGDCSDFLAALAKAKIVSPRKVLMAFEVYHSGLPATQAVGAMTFDILPEYFDVAMGVVFGQWDRGYQLPWIKDKNDQPRRFAAVCEQLKLVDDKLKKKPKEDPVIEAPVAAEPEEVVTTAEVVDEEDVKARPDAARALRAITAGILKGQIIRPANKFNPGKAAKAQQALFALAHCTSPNPFDAGMEWAATIGGLYSVNQKMNGKV